MVCEKDVGYGALPGSLWEAILAEVDATALVHLSCTSRELHQLASTSHVWRQVYQVNLFEVWPHLRDVLSSTRVAARAP